MNVNDVIGYLTLHNKFYKNKRAYWDCTCKLCGKNKDIREDSLRSGKQISCGCYRQSKEHSEKNKAANQIEDLTGNVYHELTVLHLAEKRQGKHIMWTCRCSCGKIVDVWSANLKNGNTKTCGDYKTHREDNLKKVWEQNLDDLTGLVVKDWIIKCRDETKQPTRWICKCKICGIEKSILASCLKKGTVAVCECSRKIRCLTGQKIGHWSIGKKSKRKRPNGHYCATYYCTCDCGTERYVDESRLLNGTSLSCGCVKSRANEYIGNILKQNGYKYTPEYKYDELKGPQNGLLRFDFAIQDDEDNVICLIEYQGEQHYRNDIEFGKQQREITDPQKKKFCKEHKIPLYEIKYTDNIDAKLDAILTHIACQSRAKQA